MREPAQGEKGRLERSNALAVGFTTRAFLHSSCVTIPVKRLGMATGAMRWQGLVLVLRLDAGSLAFQLAEVVQTAAAYATLGNYFNPFNKRRMEGKHAFHAHAVGNLAHGEGTASGAAMQADNVPLENLDTFLFAFNNAHVHLYGIPGLEAGNIHTQLFLFNHLNLVHHTLPSCSLKPYHAITWRNCRIFQATDRPWQI